MPLYLPEADTSIIIHRYIQIIWLYDEYKLSVILMYVFDFNFPSYWLINIILVAYAYSFPNNISLKLKYAIRLMVIP